jgi:N12 class adenine-specific DNA methylase
MLVADRGQIGRITGLNNGSVHFKPATLTFNHTKIIKDYLPLRDAYLELYHHESEQKEEQPVYRRRLKEQYQFFIAKYGDLNRKDNASVIQSDCFGLEILSLERYVNGHKKLADIFEKPVAFGAGAINAETAEEALAASLNVHGRVELTYMSAICGIPIEDLKTQLHGRIFYNPAEQNYELSDVFISGNVVEKAEFIEGYINRHLHSPETEECRQSLKALRDAAPATITFDQLDFQLGYV